MFKKLLSNIAGTLAKNKFPYTLGNFLGNSGLCRAYECFQKKKKFTVFIYDLTSGNDREKEFVVQSFKQLKILRHPHILEFEEEFETKEKLYFVTEECTLLDVSQDIDFMKKWGLLKVLKALMFLHQNGLYHFSLSMDSIFVEKDGNWKLGNFGFTTKIGGNSELLSPFHLKNYRDYVSKFCTFLPPEIKREKWNIVKMHPEKVDVFLVGSLILKIFSDTPNSKSISSFCDRCIKPNPVMRPSLEEVKDTAIFENDLFTILEFFENVEIEQDKDAIQKKVSDILGSLNDLPKNLVIRKLLPKFFYLADNGFYSKKLFQGIFMICKRFETDEKEEFKKRFLLNIFKLANLPKNDQKATTLKILILSNMNEIVDRSEGKVIEKKLFPLCLNAIKSSEKSLREASLKSMVKFAEKLPKNLVTKKVLPVMWNFTKDPNQGLRTNSVIAVGLMAKFIDPNIRARFLVKFLVTALKDNFAPTKVYAIKSLVNTKEEYDLFMISSMIIPAVSPCVISSISDLRNNAFFALDKFFESLKNGIESGELEKKINEKVSEKKEAEARKSESYLAWAQRMIKKGDSKIPERFKSEEARIKIKKKPKSPVSKGQNKVREEEKEESSTIGMGMGMGMGVSKKEDNYIQDSIKDFFDETPTPTTNEKKEFKNVEDDWEEEIPLGDIDDDDEKNQKKIDLDIPIIAPKKIVSPLKVKQYPPGKKIDWLNPPQKKQKKQKTIKINTKKKVEKDPWDDLIGYDEKEEPTKFEEPTWHEKKPTQYDEDDDEDNPFKKRKFSPMIQQQQKNGDLNDLLDFFDNENNEGMSMGMGMGMKMESPKDMKPTQQNEGDDFNVEDDWEDF